MTRDVQVTFDAADPRRLGGFWAEVLGYVDMPPPAPHGTWEDALAAWVSRRSGGTRRGRSWTRRAAGRACTSSASPRTRPARTACTSTCARLRGRRGRTDGRLAAEADRLVALGARVLERHPPEPPLGAGHVVLADPEGNEFCLD